MLISPQFYTSLTFGFAFIKIYSLGASFQIFETRCNGDHYFF